MVGWVGYDRDLLAHRAVVEAMTETMARRGPDDEGIWAGIHAILGHRRLSIIDLENGKQPMLSAAAPEAVITYTGEVYNFRELRSDLLRRGHEFATRSDTEVVLRAYLEWGEEFAQRLVGMYAFAIWDTRTEELLLVRDRMGVKPLYYYPTCDGVLFASEPKGILNHPEARAVVDEDGLREIFSMVHTPEHAVFRGMHEVRPGSSVRISRTGRYHRRYWQLHSWQHTDDLRTTIATVRERLHQAVTGQLFADVPVGTLLSGGLDSSAVTAIACRALAEQGVTDRLPAFSVDYRGHTGRFSPNMQWADADAPYAIAVAQYVQAQHIPVLLDNEDVLDPDVRDIVLHAQDLPISTGDMEYSLYLLCRELRRQVTVALSGEAADELFGGYTWFHDPDAVNSGTFPWHDPFAKLGGIGTLRAVGLWDRLELGDYIAQRYREALAEVPRLDGETGFEARLREISYLNLTRWETFLLDRKDRMSMAAALEVRVPFCDHRLVEYVFNTPWSMKSFDGREKSLLRAAMTDMVPAAVLRRKKNPYPATQDQKYEIALREYAQKLLDMGAPVLQLVPESGIRALLNVPSGSYTVGGPWGARAVLERLIEFNSWISMYNVELKL
jgi:asparagine synthase (glutamine-hydrolysing)